MYKLLIDTREDGKRVKTVMDHFDGLAVECRVDKLSICDYVGTDSQGTILFGIEFKTYADFVNSISNGHMTSQLMDMESMECPYLFVVGDFKKWKSSSASKNTSLTREQIVGYILSVNMNYKTKLIFLDSVPEFCRCIMSLFKNCFNQKHTQIVMPERHKRTGKPQLDMYLAIPGIGEKRAQEYAEKMTFFEFLFSCKVVGANKTWFKKEHGMTVTDKIIDFCREL